MATHYQARLVMLGPAPQSRGGVASMVDAYRAQGLFRRWPIDYVATHGDGSARCNARLLLLALRRLIGLLVRERGVVVHLHAAAEGAFWRDAVFLAVVIAARVPLILQLHGAGFARVYDSGGRLVRRTITWLLEQAACVIVPSESMRGWVRTVARAARVERVPPAVATAAPAQDTARPSLVLFLDRLDPAKGIYDLLEAVSALRPAVPDVRLLCAGEGDREGVAQHAERLGIADAVRFTSWVGPSGRRALFESAAALALPSYDEALPMSILEAMAAGVPVVVSPVGGLPEFIADGVSGLFAAPGDVATLQRQLRKLLFDRGLGARIGAAARESIRLRCAPERALSRLGDIYSALGVPAFGEGPRPVQDARATKAAF